MRAGGFCSRVPSARWGMACHPSHTQLGFDFGLDHGDLPDFALEAHRSALATASPSAGPDLVDPSTHLPLAVPIRRDDARAVEAWIAARCREKEALREQRPAHTARAYRREAKRFMLWLTVERQRGLCEATIEDCIEYRDFLADPQPAAVWCAPRGTRLDSPGWRPFTGPLCPRARRQSMVILHGLFAFLQNEGYLVRNPFAGVAPPSDSAPRLDPGRSLDTRQWAAVRWYLQQLPPGFAARQAGFAVRLLYACGLRLSEAVQARCGDLRQVDVVGPEGMSTAWLLKICGKGRRWREVPVPSDLIDELRGLMGGPGMSDDPRDHEERPILVAPRSAGHPADAACRPMSALCLYRHLKRVFAGAAQALERGGRRRDGEVLRRASTHWLRHTHASHSVAAGVPLDVVREVLGHASLATTSVYVNSGVDRRILETRRLTGW